MNTPNQSRDRSLYEKVLKLCPAGVIPTMGTLREQVALANNNTTYKFSFNEQKNGARRTDILLSIKDSFYVNAMSLGILYERRSKPGSGVILYYPDPFLLNDTNTDSRDVESVYNGQMKAQIDRDVLMDKLSTRRFRHVPERPTQEFTFGPSGSQQRYSLPAQQRYGDALMPVEPNLVLRGTKNNEFTITLPQFDSAPQIAATDPAFDVCIVLEAHGFLIPGGAGLNK